MMRGSGNGPVSTTCFFASFRRMSARSIPPLRERQADIAPLVSEFLTELTLKHGVSAPRFSRATQRALRSDAWPGNVRELTNVVEHLCLFRGGKPVRPEHLPEPMRSSVERAPLPPAKPTLEVRLDRALDDSIDEIIAATVALHAGNRSRAARKLGIGLRTVQRRLSPAARR